MIGSLSTRLDVRTIAVSSDLIYLGGKGGLVEIWSRENQNKIDTLQTGRNCKVDCITLDEKEEVLVVGTSEGRIQVRLFHLFQTGLSYYHEHDNYSET